MAKRKNKKKFIDLKVIVIKSFFVGILFSIIVFLTKTILSFAGKVNLKGMEAIVMILSGIFLALAMAYRDGFENMFDALISMSFVFGLWGLVAAYTGWNVIPTMALKSVIEIMILFAQFFIAEGFVHKQLKIRKVI